MAVIDIASVLRDPALRLALIYLPNFVWFFAGFVEFSLRPYRMRAGLSTAARQKTPKIGDLWHHDLLVYLGAFGCAIALSVLDAACQDLWFGLPSDFVSNRLPLYLRVWGAAHASQGLVGWTRIKPSGRWNWSKSLGPITYTDTTLCLWDFTLAFGYL